MVQKATGKADLLCSFCNKSHKAVKKIIVHGYSSICDECISQCDQVLLYEEIDVRSDEYVDCRAMIRKSDPEPLPVSKLREIERDLGVFLIPEEHPDPRNIGKLERLRVLDSDEKDLGLIASQGPYFTESNLRESVSILLSATRKLAEQERDKS